MTTPRPKRWFVWVDSWSGPYALEPKAGFMTQGEAEAHQAKMAAYYPGSIQSWILETLDAEQECRLGAYDALVAVLDMAKEYSGPSPDDVRLLIRGIGGTSKTVEAALEIAESLRAWRTGMAAAIAAAEAALGRKP